ncbi:hypothetical protein P4S84_17950, partial [Aneurinibacillus aneurinilyticus]|nr:hypothetical protein [Aneurinibacillus aneurinilyticus]
FSFQGTFKFVSFFMRLFILYQITKRFATSFLERLSFFLFAFFAATRDNLSQTIYSGQYIFNKKLFTHH